MAAAARLHSGAADLLLPARESVAARHYRGPDLPMGLVLRDCRHLRVNCIHQKDL